MRLTFEKAIQKYEASMLRRVFSKKSIRSRKWFCLMFAEWLSKNHQDAFHDMRVVTCEIIEDYVNFLALKGLKPSTMSIYVSYLKVFFGFLCKDDSLTLDPTRKLESPRVPKQEIDFISCDTVMKTLDEMFKELRKGNDYEIELRNYFIIRTAYVTGWRASESLACNPQEDIDWDTGEIYIPSGKGAKDGYVFMDPETTKMLKEWYFSRYPNGKRLWYSHRGACKGKALGYLGYLRVVKKYFNKGTHRLRAGFATYLFDQDVDIKMIQELMRHESISSTMRYVAVPRKKKRAVHALKNPFSVEK